MGIVHQSLSVLEVEDLVELIRSSGLVAIHKVQPTLKNVVSRIVGTTLAIDLRRSFDSLCDRLISPIQDCLLVQEKLEKGHVDTSSYDVWRAEALPLFGSKLHRAIRYEDRVVAQYEE